MDTQRRIGIDARFLTHPQPGGFKTYTVNLINALAGLDSDNEYFIYLDREPPEDALLPRPANFNYSVVRGTLPGVGMVLREQAGLRRQMSHDGLDLMHFLCNTACVGIRRKYVVTLHDTIQVTTEKPFSARRSLAEQKNWAIMYYSEQSILRSVGSADQIITVSNYERSEISVRLSIPLERIAVTHLAANPVFSQASGQQRLSWRTELSEDLGIHGPYIMGVGYEARKNIPLLIEAFSLIAGEIDDLILLIVAAEESQRYRFQAYAKELGVADRTIILGRVSAERLAQLYNLATLFVYPSERESFGLPPLEAMSCGVPTIAMDASSIPEIVQDGAQLVRSTSADTWADAIGALLSNDSLHADLQRRGLACASVLNWRKCAQETVVVYEKVLSSSGQDTAITSG